MKKYIHPNFRIRKYRIGLYFISIATIIFFRMMEANIIIPDWVFIVVPVLYAAGIILFIIAHKESAKEDDNEKINY